MQDEGTLRMSVAFLTIPGDLLLKVCSNCRNFHLANYPRLVCSCVYASFVSVL